MVARSHVGVAAQGSHGGEPGQSIFQFFIFIFQNATQEVVIVQDFPEFQD